MGKKEILKEISAQRIVTFVFHIVCFSISTLCDVRSLSRTDVPLYVLCYSSLQCYE